MNSIFFFLSEKTLNSSVTVNCCAMHMLQLVNVIGQLVRVISLLPPDWGTRVWTQVIRPEGWQPSSQCCSGTFNEPHRNFPHYPGSHNTRNSLGWKVMCTYDRTQRGGGDYSSNPFLLLTSDGHVNGSVLLFPPGELKLWVHKPSLMYPSHLPIWYYKCKPTKFF